MGLGPGSLDAQHGYEIVDTQTDEVVKTGVSGGKRTADGGSVRGNSQANKWNGKAGQPDRYQGRVVHEVPEGPGARQEVLGWERAHARELRAQGQLGDRDKHKRP